MTGEVLGDLLDRFGVMSGPTFALEVSRGDPTAAVVASSAPAFAADPYPVSGGAKLSAYSVCR
mgnify:CR=1 FL=1